MDAVARAGLTDADWSGVEAMEMPARQCAWRQQRGKGLHVRGGQLCLRVRVLHVEDENLWRDKCTWNHSTENEEQAGRRAERFPCVRPPTSGAKHAS